MNPPSRCPKKSPRRLSSGPRAAAAAFVVVLGLGVLPLVAQERGPTAVSAEDLRKAIDHLGDLEYASRMAAGRTVRRAPPAQVVPALIQAVGEHADGYIRFRALVLLTGFNDLRTADAMTEAMSSPNDRLREVAYGYFERNPEPRLVPTMLSALDREVGDFVRPALVRALAAAAAKDTRVTAALIRDADRGVDFFRSTVIEALGDYRIAAAVPKLTEIANLEGPLQDDAVTALGKIGDKASLATLAKLQQAASRELQPAIAAAICLLGSNCSSHVGFLEKTLTFAEDYPGYQELLRGAASGLGVVAARGHEEALKILFDVGVPSQDPVRAPVTLAVGLVALRNTPFMLRTLETRADQDQALGLLAEAFDMLEEDLEEERFFVAARRAYWAAADGSPTRRLCEQLITRLDF
jgi:HEAT repeat protein